MEPILVLTARTVKTRLLSRSHSRTRKLMHIQAAVRRANDGPFTLETVEMTAPRRHEILVRIVGTGFCHTDVLPRNPAFLAQPPIILGHEGSGIVESVGTDVTRT